LPFRSGYFADLRAFVNGTRWIAETPEAGHNPLGRLMVTLLLLLMTAQASTGLILAGTDLYKPPLGGWVAEWVTDGDASRLAQLQPGSKDFVVAEKYAEMRAFRKPYKNIHEILFYVLAGAIVLHVIGVILFEFRSKQGLVSAMITGKKSLPRSSQEETPPWER